MLIKMDYTFYDFYNEISESERRDVYNIVDLVIVDTINRYKVDYDSKIPPRYIEMVFDGLATHTITYPVDRNFKLFERIILHRYSHILNNKSEYNLYPILKNTEKLNSSCDIRQRYFTDDQLSLIKDNLDKIYDDNIDNIVGKYRDGLKDYPDVFNQDTIDEMCNTYRKTIEFITEKDGVFAGTLDKYRKINDRLSENGLIEPYINTDVVFNSYESRLIKNILYSIQNITGLCCITDAFVNECKDLIINIFNERNVDLDTNKIDELSDIILFYNKEYYYKEVKSPYSGLISKIKIPVNGGEYAKEQIREEISAKYGINKNSTDEELNFIISDYSKNHNVLDKLDPKSEFDYIREFVGNKKNSASPIELI